MSVFSKYQVKPMTLYVSTDGISEITPEHYGIEIEHIIDIQLSEQDAKKLRDTLNTKLNVEVYGAVSFRLTGRLVI